MAINMPDKNSSAGTGEPELIKVLDSLLEQDEDITARAVARLHPTVKHASSITRNEIRSNLLAQYQAKQREIRSYAARLRKGSKEKVAVTLAEKDLRIAELERQIELLTASHVAMIRAVGELGGMSKWAKFYEQYREMREKLVAMGALGSADVRKINDADSPSDRGANK